MEIHLMIHWSNRQLSYEKMTRWIISFMIENRNKDWNSWLIPSFLAYIPWLSRNIIWKFFRAEGSLSKQDNKVNTHNKAVERSEAQRQKRPPLKKKKSRK